MRKNNGFTAPEFLFIVFMIIVITIVLIYSYNKYTKKLKEEPKPIIIKLWNVCEQYHQQTGVWITDLDRLLEQIEVEREFLDRWELQIIDNPPQKIMAISTKKMELGKGIRIIYDIRTKKWSEVKSGDRNQETGVRRQKSGDRNQETGVRRKKCPIKFSFISAVHLV